MLGGLPFRRQLGHSKPCPLRKGYPLLLLFASARLFCYTSMYCGVGIAGSAKSAKRAGRKINRVEQFAWRVDAAS